MSGKSSLGSAPSPIDDAWGRTIPHHAEGMKPDIAFYYPGQYWGDPDWAKNLVLFFDGIGMRYPSCTPSWLCRISRT